MEALKTVMLFTTIFAKKHMKLNKPKLHFIPDLVVLIAHTKFVTNFENLGVGIEAVSRHELHYEILFQEEIKLMKFCPGS